MHRMIAISIMTGVLMSAAVPSGAASGKHLFILSGQSNMAGLDPAVSFTPAVEKAFGKASVIVIKSARGGQPIRRWYKAWKPATGAAPEKTGDLYDVLLGKVNGAITDQKIATVTFVWMQGERDAKESHGDVYGASFKGLVDQLKQDLQHDELNFVIGRISDYDMKNERYAHWTKVRDVQVEVAEGDVRGAWVDTDDLNNKSGKDGKVRSDLHYTKAGYRRLGQRFADQAIRLVKAGQ